MRQRGWLETVNMMGRPYVTAAAAREFERRVAAGEFSKPPSGAARKNRLSATGAAKGGQS